MTIEWIQYDESMLYPSKYPAIPFYLLIRQGEVPNQYKMLLQCDKPTDEKQLEAVREIAEHEVEETQGMWAGELRALVLTGNITFDLVFASELIDSRKVLSKSADQQ